MRSFTDLTPSEGVTVSAPVLNPSCETPAKSLRESNGGFVWSAATIASEDPAQNSTKALDLTLRRRAILHGLVRRGECVSKGTDRKLRSVRRHIHGASERVIE